jgi:hypothetical protein
VPTALLVVGALGALGAAAGAFLVRRGRRRREVLGVDGAVAELERALRRAGRGPTGGLTLARLEERLRGSPDAAGYVRTVRTAPLRLRRRDAHARAAAGPAARARRRPGAARPRPRALGAAALVSARRPPLPVAAAG